MRRKPGSIRLLQKKLWGLCRDITRIHYGNTCFTCGAKNLSGSNYQTGHFIPSSVCSVELRYSLDNLRVQCASCNIWKSGNWPAYEEALKREGLNPEELKIRNRKTQGKQYDQLWYRDKIKDYQLILEKSV